MVRKIGKAEQKLLDDHLKNLEKNIGKTSEKTNSTLSKTSSKNQFRR